MSGDRACMSPEALSVRDHCCWHRSLSSQQWQPRISSRYLRHPLQSHFIQQRSRFNYAMLATYPAPSLEVQAATVGQLPRLEAAAAAYGNRRFRIFGKAHVQVGDRMHHGIYRLQAAPISLEVASAAYSAWSLWDPAAVTAASAASFKLLFLCGVIAWMSHRCVCTL